MSGGLVPSRYTIPPYPEVLDLASEDERIMAAVDGSTLVHGAIRVALGMDGVSEALAVHILSVCIALLDEPPNSAF